MFRALAVFTVGCTFLVAGCRDDNNNFKPVDLSMSMDDMGGGGAVDMKMPTNYVPHTINEIDTGAVTTHQAVKVTDVIATSIVAYFKSKSQTICTYEVYVQDPSCNTPPCGIAVQADGPMVSNNTCPKATQSGT